MDKIKYSDIDFSSLKIIGNDGNFSTVYECGDKCIKIINGLYENELHDLQKKFLMMEDIKIDNVIFPEKFIFKGDEFVGYTMERVINSKTLFDKFLEYRYINVNEIFSALKKASLILREIHKNEIIVNDLSFDNILIDEEGNIKFIDMDGSSYKNYMSGFVSILIKNLFYDYRKEKVIRNYNLDRISMMISMFYIIYLKEIQFLNRKKYHRLSDNIKTLENAREYANILIDYDSEIKYIPYLDELIDDTDNYVIDRDKEVSIENRLKYMLKIKG